MNNASAISMLDAQSRLASYKANVSVDLFAFPAAIPTSTPGGLEQASRRFDQSLQSAERRLQPRSDAQVPQADRSRTSRLDRSEPSARSRGAVAGRDEQPSRSASPHRDPIGGSDEDPAGDRDRQASIDKRDDRPGDTEVASSGVDDGAHAGGGEVNERVGAEATSHSPNPVSDDGEASSTDEIATDTTDEQSQALLAEVVVDTNGPLVSTAQASTDVANASESNAATAAAGTPTGDAPRGKAAPAADRHQLAHGLFSQGNAGAVAEDAAGQRQQGLSDHGAAKQDGLLLATLDHAAPPSGEGGFAGAMSQTPDSATLMSSQASAPGQGETAIQAASASAARIATPGATGSVALSASMRPVADSPLMNSTGAEDDVNVARVARGLNSALNQRGGAVTLRLTPPEMGLVRIQMQVQDGSVTAQLSTQQDAARQLLHQQLAQLRHALESQGLTVERLEVQTMSSSNTSLNGQEQGQSGRDAQQSAADGRSRGGFAQQGQSGDGHPGNRDERDGEGRPRTRASFASWMNDVGTEAPPGSSAG